jgi:dCMP deaminase
MKDKFIQAYMKTAYVFAGLSYAKKLQVGAIAVRDHQILATGYNGTPIGQSNELEYKIYFNPEVDHIDDDGYTRSEDEIKRLFPYYDDINRYQLITKPEVIHAEMNCIAKLASSTESGKGASLFVTTAPCLKCSLLILQSGISEVYYHRVYRSTDGIEFLRNVGIDLIQVSN